MSLIFRPENHEYISTDGEDIEWLSATTVTGAFKQPFLDRETATKCSKSKKSKWYGLSVEEILSLWKNEARRATDLGTWYHDQREQDLCEIESVYREGFHIPIHKPIYDEENVKHAPIQKLSEGIYPEHFVYLKSAGICGQSDYVEVVNNTVNITDYKTNKEIKISSYVNWEGKSQKMQYPVQHLDDCHINHYALQLSLYLYIILRHNPRLKPGKLTINHIIFEEVGRDRYDNPITALDSQGNPIVKEIVQYDVPYLKSEIINLLAYVKDNRDKIKKK